METKFVELTETGREMSPNEREIAANLIAMYIKRSDLIKPKNLYFVLYYGNEIERMELNFSRGERSFTAERWTDDFGYKDVSFNWY